MSNDCAKPAARSPPRQPTTDLLSLCGLPYGQRERVGRRCGMRRRAPTRSSHTPGRRCARECRQRELERIARTIVERKLHNGAGCGCLPRSAFASGHAGGQTTNHLRWKIHRRTLRASMRQQACARPTVCELEARAREDGCSGNHNVCRGPCNRCGMISACGCKSRLHMTMRPWGPHIHATREMSGWRQESWRRATKPGRLPARTPCRHNHDPGCRHHEATTHLTSRVMI